MSEIFKRKAVVTIGETEVSSDDLSIKLIYPFGTAGITNSKIYIFNPSDNIIAACTGDPSVQVEAGHQDEVLLVLAGECHNHKLIEEGPDLVLTIGVTDKKALLSTAKLNKNFSNQSSSAIIKSVCSDVGIDVETCKPGNDVTIEKFVVRGVREAIESLAKKTESRWYFRHGKFIFESLAAKTSPIVVEENTGLVGIPKRTGDIVSFKTVFLNSITQGKTVLLKYEGEELEARITSGLIRFSSFDNDHGMEFEATV